MIYTTRTLSNVRLRQVIFRFVLPAPEVSLEFFGGWDNVTYSLC